MKQIRNERCAVSCRDAQMRTRFFVRAARNMNAQRGFFFGWWAWRGGISVG